MKFEQYLQDQHSKHYMGTDDDMSDNFDKWLQEMDVTELVELAENWSVDERLREYQAGATSILDKLEALINKRV